MKRLFPFLPTRPKKQNRTGEDQLHCFEIPKGKLQIHTHTHTHTHTHFVMVHGYIRAKESPAEWCVGFEYGLNLSGNCKVYKITL